MRYLSLLLAGLLAGCGGGDDSSTRYFAAFIATPLANQLAAAHLRKEDTQGATLIITRTPAPAAHDAFQAQVRTVVSTPAQGGEPVDVDAVPVSTPDASEPAPL